jgi:hypothetical protein
MMVLPGTGRGTMRSMVEGIRLIAQRVETSPLHHSAGGPPPRPGEEF